MNGWSFFFKTAGSALVGSGAAYNASNPETLT